MYRIRIECCGFTCGKGDGAEVQIAKLFHQMGTIEFWEHLLESFQALGPLIPILLAALESVIPVLPLVGIVTVNVAAHGPLMGFIYSWVGTCLGCFAMFFIFRRLFTGWADRMASKHKRIAQARNWVSRMRPTGLFLILILPFTPSSFVNFAFGISQFDAKKYLITLPLAKLFMIGSLTAFGQSVRMALKNNPLYLILAVALLAVLYVASKFVSKKYDV